MYFPHPRYITYKVAAAIHRMGGATSAQLIEALPDHNPKSVMGAIQQLMFNKAAEVSKGTYTVRRYIGDYIDQNEPGGARAAHLVQPRTAMPFKPLNPANLPRRELPRAECEPLRDISFKTGTAGVWGVR